MTSTQPLPSTYAVYGLVIAARDHGDPARITVVDLDIIVNDTAAEYLRHAGGGITGRLANSSMFSDDRFFVVFGMICGVLIVSLLVCVICAVLLLRGAVAKWSNLKPSCDPARDHKETCTTADNDVTTSDWDAEYTRMINVRITLANHRKHS